MSHPKFFRNHHGTQFRQCAACDGGGSIDRNDSNPHGYGPDPQQGYQVRCHECGGDGDQRVTPVDTLELLRAERRLLKAMRGTSLLPGVRRRYTQRLVQAMKPVTLPGPTPRGYLASLRRTDPVAAEIFAPVFRAMGFAA